MAEPQPDLREFLIYAARHGYADDAVEKLHEDNGSTSIRIQHGDWLAHDNYFTSEDGRRFGGSLVVFLGDRALWSCGYRGDVSEHANPGEVYGFLKKAMLQPDEEFPVRGPWHFAEGEFNYDFHKTDPKSTLDRFETIEFIAQDGTTVYEGVFYGGKID